MNNAKNRKNVPHGEIPDEIWRRLLHPQWLPPGQSFRWGIGSDQTFPSTDKWVTMFKRLMQTIHKTGCMPIPAFVNQGVTVPKKHVSAAVEDGATLATRPIHLYSPFAQCMGKAIERSVQRDNPYSSQFGAIKGRRREEAIAT